MLKKINLLIVLSLCLACATSKHKAMESYNLNGIWIPVKQTFNGKDFPISFYNNYKLTLKDSTYTYGILGTEDIGTIAYRDGKMDIWGKAGTNAGKHFTAIYKLENEELIISYNLAGTSYPQQYETTSSNTFFMSTYKKEK